MSEHERQTEERLASAIAPEDIREGDYLAVLAVLAEYLPLGPLFECTFDIPRSLEPVRVQWLPCAECVPLKVEAVCLPWVVVKEPARATPGGPPAFALFGNRAANASPTTLRTLDVRRYRLARLPQDYGKRVYRMLKDRATKRGGSAACAGDDDET